MVRNIFFRAYWKHLRETVQVQGFRLRARLVFFLKETGVLGGLWSGRKIFFLILSHKRNIHSLCEVEKSLRRNKLNAHKTKTPLGSGQYGIVQRKLTWASRLPSSSCSFEIN